MNLKRRIDLLERSTALASAPGFCTCEFDYAAALALIVGDVAVDDVCSRCGKPFGVPVSVDWLDELVGLVAGRGGSDEPETAN